MRVRLVTIAARGGDRAWRPWLDVYLARLQGSVAAEEAEYRTVEAFWAANDKSAGRRAPVMVLLDSRGTVWSSEQLAAWMGRERDGGRQEMVFAIGPADGWKVDDRARAHLLLSFGPMTFPHELARVMLAEQVYRAFTILAGHPYHCGH